MAAAVPGYFMIEGWVSRAELYANGLAVPSFPVQSDQNNGRLWTRPGNAADILAPARLVDTPMGARFGYGGIVWQWPLVNLSPKMVAYIQQTYFQPNGSPSNFFYREWSNKLTVQTFNRASGEWETYHTWARLADYRNEATPTAGGYTDMVINFTAFKLAPEGPDLAPSIAIQGSAPYYEGSELTYVFTVQNVGDNDSLSNSQWEIAIPANTELVSISIVYPTTLEYSTNNGSTYSSIAPSPLSSTTNIRGTLTTELEAGDITDDYTLVLVPSFSGALDVTVAVTTDNDQDGDNDTDTESITLTAFNPVAYVPSLWFDGDLDVESDGVLQTPAADSDPVEVWRDQSSNNYVIQQSTLANRPTYTENALNGHGGVNFNGTDQEMTVTSFAETIEGAMVWYFVVVPTSVASGGRALISMGDYQFYFQTPVNTETNVGARTDTSGYAEIDTAITGGQVLAFVVDPTAPQWLSVYRDGVLLGTAALVDFDFAPIVRLGAGLSSLIDVFDGDICEVLVYNATPNTLSIDYVTEYLMNKYGIS